MLTNNLKRDIIALAQALRGYHYGGGCFLEIFEEEYLLPSSDNEGGDIMDYLTWQDAIQIALLVIAIISCFYNKNEKR